jgi:hypothetical protein
MKQRRPPRVEFGYATAGALLLAVSLGLYNLLGPAWSTTVFLVSMTAASFGALGVLVMRAADARPAGPIDATGWARADHLEA